MKNMCRIFTIATFLMFCLVINTFSQTTDTSSSGQTKMTIEQKATSIADEMTKVAALTPDEVSKVIPLVTEFLKQKEIDLAQNKGNEDALSAARKTRMTNLSNKLKDVVTSSQYVKLKEYLRHEDTWDTQK